MNILLQPAVKVLKSIKLLSYGPSYSGKTMSSLLLAVGIVMGMNQCTEAEAYKRIVLLDTEYGRGALYHQLGAYNYIRIDPPYDTNQLAALVKELSSRAEIDVIIIDSLTHYWAKEGGILDQKSELDKKGGNSFTNWQGLTAVFNKALDSILSSPKHVLITARAKSDTMLVTNEKGKAVPKTYGLKPELREGIEYEFDIVFNVDKETHSLIVDKGIPRMELYYPEATPVMGQMLYDLFTADAVIPVRSLTDVQEAIRVMARTHNLVTFTQLALAGRSLDKLSMDELLELETKMTAEVRRLQTK